MALRLALSPTVHMIVSLVPQPGGIEKNAFWLLGSFMWLQYYLHQQSTIFFRKQRGPNIGGKVGGGLGGGVDSYVSGILVAMGLWSRVSIRDGDPISQKH